MLVVIRIFSGEISGVQRLLSPTLGLSTNLIGLNMAQDTHSYPPQSYPHTHLPYTRTLTLTPINPLTHSPTLSHTHPHMHHICTIFAPHLHPHSHPHTYPHPEQNIKPVPSYVLLPYALVSSHLIKVTELWCSQLIK